MPRRLVLAVAALLSLTACMPSAHAPPPPPPGAEAIVEEGPQELMLDSVVLQIREAVQDKRHPLKVDTYRLGEAADWPAVSAYYEKLLARPRDRRLAEQLRGAHARAWREGGAVVAVALVDGPLPGADRRPLLVVASS